MIELKGLHVLIAEDDLDDGEFIQNSFTKHASFSRINWVKNGRELLQFLRDESKPIPDIILTDLNMPLINGIEALETIFNDSRLSRIPCFVYSSTVNPVYEEKCRQLGIKAFLLKPFSLRGFDEIPYEMLYILNPGTIKNNPS